MTGIRIRIGDTEIRAAAGDLARLRLNTGALLRDIGEGLLLSTDERFRAQVDPDGAAWAPLSETTLGRRRRGRRGSGGLSSALILRESGHMQDDTIDYEVHGDYLLQGSNAIQSAVQHYGAAKHSLGPTTPWGDIPPRPHIGLSARDEQEIAQTTLRHLGRALGSG